MNKKIIIPTILFIIILIFSFIIILKDKKNSLANDSNNSLPESQIVLFYGTGCPHCANVEKYIRENNIKDKINFEEKEVYYNRKNADDLVAKAKICGIPTNYIGVPFLWDGEKCFVGDKDIIDFFKQKTNR